MNLKRGILGRKAIEAESALLILLAIILGGLFIWALIQGIKGLK